MTATHAANTGARVPRGHAPGAWTQVTGLSLLTLAPLTLFVVGAATGADVGDGAIFLVIALVLAIGTVLAALFGTWAKALGIVLTVLAALAGFWLAFGLLAPDSPVDFVVGAMFVAGVVLSIVGGVQAIRHRATSVGAATRGEARAGVLAITVVAVALVASLATNLLSRTTIPVAEAAGTTPVTMDAFEFATSTVTVAAGEDARLLVSNQDAFLHDFAIPDQGIEAVDVAPGSQVVVDVSGLEPGTYTFWCTLHSDTSVADPADAGMAGTLEVE